VTADHLKEFIWRPVPHRPFSVNLVASDCRPLDAIKGKIAGPKFGSAEQFVSEVTDIASFISQITSTDVFRELEQRLQKCIDMK
jgi:hypothetical protein